MDTASKDVLFTIAINLELPSLLRWCQSNSRIRKHVCNNDDVWRSKLLQDYPDYEKFNLNRSLRETYVFMYQLSYIKSLLQTEESLYDIFRKKKISFSRKKLKKVPAFDLPNLDTLELSYNELSEVPQFSLPNLRYLYIDNNELTKIPNFSLPKLERLDLHKNKLDEVPIFDFPQLISLDISYNKLKEIPIFNLPNLQTISLDNNYLTKIPLFHLSKLNYISVVNNNLDKREKDRLRRGNSTYLRLN